MTDSPLNVTVSCFAHSQSTEPQPVNLLTWLTTDKYKERVEVIRATDSKEERTKLKQRLPGITPSGIFSIRKAVCLKKHSRLLCLDIDHQDNTHIGNFQKLKEELAKIQNFAYIGLSVSGNGYFCLVPISQPEKHKQHFKSLHRQLAKFGIVLDTSGSDVSRLRYASYDKEAYFNHSAKVYKSVFEEEKRKPQSQPQLKYNSDNNKPLDIVVNMVKGATDGQKHHTLYRAARLAGGYIAGDQIDESEAVEALQAAIKTKANVLSLEDAFKTIADGITIGKDAPIKGQSDKSDTVTNEIFELTMVEEPHTKPLHILEPVKIATGRLAELEDFFVKNREAAQGQRQKIVSLFDQYKRESPTAEQIEELERLLAPPKNRNLRPALSQPEVLFSRT